MQRSLDYSNRLYVDQIQRHVGHLQPVMMNHNEPIKDDWNPNIPPRFNNNPALMDIKSLRLSRNKKNIQQTPTATNPSRSSPLRRFLDPLLNPKGAHLTQKVHKLKLEATPSVGPNELVYSKKHGLSNVQALLQLTLKNGIPFFKLVVEGTSDILAAAVKKLPSGKDDTSVIYALYSAHDTKKKSGGWMYYNSKEKSCCFEYNMSGQMKISSSYHYEFNGTEKDVYVVRESVLYGTGTTRADEKSQKTVDCGCI